MCVSTNNSFNHKHTSNDTCAYKCVLLLDVVVAQRAPVLELLAGEDQALLVRGDALLVLDLGLHAFVKYAVVCYVVACIL